jgi:hypothetical protein
MTNPRVPSVHTASDDPCTALDDPNLYCEATQPIFRGETLSQPTEDPPRPGRIMCYSRCKIPTLHKFAGRREVIINRAIGTRYFEHIFECCVCGCRRVWGTEQT